MADDESIFLNKDYLYELVGCDELSTEEQIITEYKIKAKTLHPDKNSGDDEEFIRLNKAKEILCDKEQRKKYDFWRRSGLAIPFDAWLKTDKFNRMSFHWAPKPKKEKMIESCHKESGICNNEDDIVAAETSRKRKGDGNGCDAVAQKISPARGWERKTDDSKLNKFRNYMI